MSPLHREGPLPPPTWAAYGAQTAVRGRPWMKLPLLRKKWFATNNVVVFFFFIIVIVISSSFFQKTVRLIKSSSRYAKKSG